MGNEGVVTSTTTPAATTPATAPTNTAGDQGKPNAIPTDRSAAAPLGGGNIDDGEAPEDGAKAGLPADKKKELTAAEKREWKLKFKDKDITITDEKKAQELMQKGLQFDHSGWESAKARKEAEAAALTAREKEQQFNTYIEKLQENPVEALMHLYNGDTVKVREALEPWLGKQILQDIEDQENPHQKQIREANARAEAAEKKLKAQAEAEETTKKEAELNHWRDHHQKRIMGLLQEAKLPCTPEAIKKWADLQYRYAAQGMEPNQEAIAEQLRNGYIENSRFVAGHVTKGILEAHAKNDTASILAIGEQLQQLFGEDTVKALRIFDLTRLKEQRKVLPTPEFETPRTAQVDEGAGQKPGQYMDMDEWREQAKERAQKMQKGEAVPNW